MARVTKINVGGTNYDIAHEGVLKNSGFEVVTSLPKTGLFEGREVVYRGIKYVYNNGWRNQYCPVNLPRGVTLQSSTEELTNAATVIELDNFELSQIPGLLNNSLFISNNTNVVKQSDRLYELIDNETGDITVLSHIVNPVLGQTLRYTVINPSGSIRNLHDHLLKNNNSVYASYCVNIPQNARPEKAVYKVEYYINTNATGDGDVFNKDNYTWKTVFEKELRQYTIIIYPLIETVYYYGTTKSFILNVRVSITPTTKIYDNNISIRGIDVLYYGMSHISPVYANRLINFDAVIEPTQTSTEFKSPLWLWQYLTQGVNWLKANKVALSVYNAKVAELMQADSANNASIQSVSTDLTELSNGLAAVATSGSYNDLTDKPTFSGSYNDLTDKPTLATVATSGNYDDLLNKPALVFSNIGGTISSVQIPDGLIANAKLANPSMSLNGTTVNLGDTANVPWYLDYNEVDYPARIRDHWLQIYRNGVWANLMYLGDILPTQVGQITSLDNLDWYNEQVSEYEVDSTTTTSILNGTTSPAALLLSCTAEHLTLNLYPISGKQYGKGSLDSLITDLQGKGFSVFVENDLDAIIGSGSDYLVRIKISKVPTPKAIIECYVSR